MGENFQTKENAHLQPAGTPPPFFPTVTTTPKDFKLTGTQFADLEECGGVASSLLEFSSSM